MIFDWKSRIRDWKKDLFIHTQNRLTLQYSVLIMVFLMLFILIVYFLINTIISYQQKQELESIAFQQGNIIRNAIQDDAISARELDNLRANQESGTQFFYYVVRPNGQLLFGDEVIHPLQPQILQLLQGWVPQENDIRYATVDIHPHGHDRHRSIDLMMTGRALFQGDQLVGIFYIGKDISFYNQLIHQLLTTLVILGVLFLGIALLLSYFMSKRAMIPIRRSFNRQREFVADASHELRTPLSILNSSLDVLQMEEGEHLSDFSQKIMSNMKDEVKRMTHLVGNLLTLARSDSGSPHLQLERFDLVPSVEQLVQSTQTLANSKMLSLRLKAPSRLVIQGDHERIKQLLYILLDNAIKYTPDSGEVSLTLLVQAYEKQPALQIVVQDSGIGIPPEEQEHIFDRFYRVDKNRSRQMGGTGLGLAIAKWIVEAHHGTIQVASTLGKGSTFTIIMPVVDETA
ncbi:ATP-binding protein [Aneurinibacillus sp. Ricciae_BoGa-3]|uniref:sensor histidine kinase n=1 Tax=Aneurinibacillus sp. Ricciae_BoGa-3 TaxID=3022697 RepID=UPI00233F9076|nr:ATP-binding protein [Aneurinibacillus sp. Ricciae_BoGa-3]WCK54019.1 ATP-binding protein [Aneurinibacillus sp. Ricciae_BoGa-3]